MNLGIVVTLRDAVPLNAPGSFGISTLNSFVTVAIPVTSNLPLNPRFLVAVTLFVLATLTTSTCDPTIRS